MKIFAIGDLHLSFGMGGREYKPMNIFGDEWEGHSTKVHDAWKGKVGPEDVVLIPGDISWAMTLEEFLPDLDFIASLPGRKIMTKGNHDFWWQSVSKVRKILPEGIEVIQNDHVMLSPGLYVAGTRGWKSPGEPEFTDDDLKIYRREVQRLELSLAGIPEKAEKIAMLHYPPCNYAHEKNEMVEVLERYNVHRCIYGHLHGRARRKALSGEKWGIDFRLVSIDEVGFSPELIAEY